MATSAKARARRGADAPAQAMAQVVAETLAEPAAEAGAEADAQRRSVQSIEVGGRLLLALAAHPGPMGLKDLAARADLPPSRAHPYLVSWLRLGLVEQDPGSGRYALGPAALQLGLAYLNQLDAVKVAQPVAEALAAQTGLAVTLSVWGNFGPTVIRMIDARQPLHIALRTGTVMSLRRTATGRCFAALMPLDRLAGAHAMDQPEADGDLAGLRQDRESALRELREHGVTRAVGRPIPGVNAFGAPALDQDGQPAIVFTMIGNQDRLKAAWEGPCVTALRAAAADLSRRLGWNRPGLEATPR